MNEDMGAVVEEAPEECVSPGWADNRAPYPFDLERLVHEVQYKPSFRFDLRVMERGQSCDGLTLHILVSGQNSYNPDAPIMVSHLFVVPAAAYNLVTWRRWLFERILDVERHEAMEHFEVNGEKVYSPQHAPGCDPYVITEWAHPSRKRTPGSKT